MERLTHYDNVKQCFWITGYVSHDHELVVAAQKLGKYEDLDRSPEQVAVLMYENAHLRSELETVTKQRDMAVEDLQNISIYNGSLTCHCNDILKIATKWRGIDKEADK